MRIATSSLTHLLKISTTLHLMPVVIISLVTLVACDAIGLASGACYVDDFKIIKVYDAQDVEYEPRKMTLTFAFGTIEHDYCGIPSDAIPLDQTFSGTFGVQNTYPVFGVKEAEDTRTSLAGNEREVPPAVILGTRYRGEFSDELSMWPLYNSEWR